jgi:wyosine [tRNA(Phe)-imidazoG37] synthetase (radical SAM superfamily)
MRDHRDVLRESALLYGVLPLSSTCNLSCVFCSNYQNPPGVEVYNIPPRPLEEVISDVHLLRAHDRIVIGESATRINEGEPYAYEDIDLVIREIRKKLPGKQIAITTNGVLVGPREVAVLQEAGGVEVTVSLNALGSEARHALMRDDEPERAPKAIRLFGDAGIDFHGSLVAVPAVTGWDDLAATLRCLAESGALTARVFIPGCTRVTRRRLFDDRDLPRLREEVSRVSEETRMPVLVEPEPLGPVSLAVLGVIRGSSAARAGLCPGDLVVEVDGVRVETSADAHSRMTNAASPRVTVRRGGDPVEVQLQKPSGRPPGAVMRDDMSGARLKKVVERLRAHAGRSALMVSEFAASFWEDVVASRGLDRCRVFTVRAELFGGNIRCAGLLTVGDFTRATRDEHFREWAPGLVLLPKEPFDPAGRDLVGESWQSFTIGLDTVDRCEVEVM